MEPKKVRLSELQRGHGLCCPRCHCYDVRVDRTMRVTAGIRRYRKCRNCGFSFSTNERMA